jgi:membrane peptidoglycan carboxypeptidase
MEGRPLARRLAAQGKRVTGMREREHHPLLNVGSLVVCGLLAGVVVAALAFPMVVVSGLVAKAGVDSFDQLPADVDVPTAPQISYVYASDGKTLLAMLYDENRRDVPLSSVATVMQQAIVASEDSRFFGHRGVDIKGVARAFVANQRSNTTQGASTLTMQYVRLAIAYSARTPQQVIDATERTPARKLREMKYSMALEKKLSKQQILERYLNIASFGHRAWGVFAASQVYFDKEPKDLTLGEAALLAGLLKAPSAYDPTTPEGFRAALERRDTYVLPQMLKLGYVTEAQVEETKKAVLKIVGKDTPEGCGSTLRPELGASFFCDFLYRWWLEQPMFGADGYERETRLKGGGYSIITTLDVAVQRAAKKNIEDQVKTGDYRALMIAGLEPGTGRVQALAVNRNYSNDQTNNGPNTNPAKRGLKGNYPDTTIPLLTGGGDVVGYQAGSTFKMFTLVAALERGFPLAYTIDAISPQPTSYIVDRSGEAACPGTNKYCPVNANPQWMNGPRNMWTGMGRSVNTYWVPLQERVGAENVVAVAKKLGIKFRAKGTREHPSDAEFAGNPAYAHNWGPFTLGVAATTPLELTNAYATLAAEGKYCEPLPVLEVRNPDGSKLDGINPRCSQVVAPDVARAATDVLRCPVGDQSAYRQCDGATAGDTRDIVNKPIAGKTGTTDHDWTAGLVVMTRQLAIGGLLADPDNPRPKARMTHNAVNAAVARTLHDGMVGKPAMNFTPPSQEIAFGKQDMPLDVRCQSIAAAQARLKAAGYRVAVTNVPVPSTCPPGTVGQVEITGTPGRGGTATIRPSAGRRGG